MKGRGVPLAVTLIMGSTGLLMANNLASCDYFEKWEPYIPLSRQVDLIFRTANGVAFIDTTITFTCAGYRVSDWGIVIKDDHNIWADSQIWRWTGPSAQVITEVLHTYDLGHLKLGNYTFTFEAWGWPVKRIDFTIPGEGDVNHDRVVDIEDLAIIARALWTTPQTGGNPGEWWAWNPACDLNNDLQVDGLDLSTASLSYGKTY